MVITKVQTYVKHEFILVQPVVEVPVQIELHVVQQTPL